VIQAILAALQLYVASLLAVVFMLWAALVALAVPDDSGIPSLLSPTEERRAGTLSPTRTLHVMHLALLAVAAALAATALGWWAWDVPHSAVRYVLAVFLVWILGDLAPRLWVANEPGLISYDGRFIQHTITIFRPALAAMTWLDRRLRLRHPGPRLGHVPERQMLSGVMSLAEMQVAEVMTPRLDIISVDFSSPRAQVIETFRSAEHSRLLVVDGDPDSVTGVIYAKDLLPGLADGDAEADWHSLIRPIEFVPEAKSLDRQLRDFQRSASHLVVVVDEFGGTSGIVTLEDVLEQIVGEIRDEYDIDEVAPVQRLPEGGWAVQGGVALADLESELGHSFAREDISTVGGLVLALFGRVPKTAESVELDGFRLTVDQIVRRRVRRITVAPVTPEVGEGRGEEADQ
jgi:magnesium and cobalt transporter